MMAAADEWEIHPRPNPRVRDLLRLMGRSFSRRHLQCENARFIVCELPVRAERARRILPFGLKLTTPPRAMLFLVDYTRPTFSFPYHEANLFLYVRSPLGRGVHSCWIVVDDDTPLIYGRATLAYPKKMAQFVFEEEEEGSIRASVTRRGVELIHLEARRKGPLAKPGPVFGMKTFNPGGIGHLLAVNPIWMSRLHETATEAYELDMDLTLTFSETDPIAELIDEGGPINPRLVIEDIAGSRYLLPVGLAGPRWMARTFFLRIR